MKKSVLAVTLFLATASVAQANSGTLNFNGTIRDTACSIDASDQNQTITFGDVAKSLINGGGVQRLKLYRSRCRVAVKVR